MSFRSLFFCAICSTVLGFLLTSVIIKGYRASSGSHLHVAIEPINDRVISDENYQAPPTDFYLRRQRLAHLSFSPDRKPLAIEIELENVLPILILNDADLLADQALADCSQFVSPEQLFQAKLLTKNRYDQSLKELRRKRSEILERLGAGTENAEEELEKIRIQTWELLNEVRASIFRDVFSFEEREQIYAFFNERGERAAAARAASSTANEHSSDVPNASDESIELKVRNQELQESNSTGKKIGQ